MEALRTEQSSLGLVEARPDKLRNFIDSLQKGITDALPVLYLQQDYEGRQFWLVATKRDGAGDVPMRFQSPAGNVE